MTAGDECGMVDRVEKSTCPSCAHESPVVVGAVEPPFPASPECYAAYQELAAYNLERGRVDFLHQTAVDAYAAQHPGPPAKPISTWFALVGLHLAVDRGFSGREVQRAHMRLGRRPRAWPVLPPPDDLQCMRAANVMRRPPGDARDEAVLAWAIEVWHRWSGIHQAIASLCTDERLGAVAVAVPRREPYLPST